MRPVLERFLEKINIPDDKSKCWIWNGATIRGYGLIRISGKGVFTHRLAYTMLVGEIPEGMCILHTCDVSNCCNPTHLRVGTNKDNSQDMVAKGRHIPVRGESHGIHKLKEKDIPKIRRMVACGYTLEQIGKVFGVSYSTIFLVKSGRTWTHVGRVNK